MALGRLNRVVKTEPKSATGKNKLRSKNLKWRSLSDLVTASGGQGPRAYIGHGQLGG